MTTTTTTDTDRQERYESPELGSAIARMIRGLVDRASDGDTEALEQLAALEQLVPQAVTLAGYLMHDYGYSHQELANVLGVSRQASVKRFGPVTLDSQPLDDQVGYSWASAWWGKSVSSGYVMRSLVARVAARRSR